MTSVLPLSKTFSAPASAVRLDKFFVKKPWGRTELPSQFGPRGLGRIGEIWFAGGPDERLLPKYLFTSEKLSIQVHPGARENAFWPGKTECWYVLDAAPDAVVGLGLKESVSSDCLHSAAKSGAIETLLDWRPVRRGDFLVVTPGTIHAVGGGITLLEVGQNSDATYRLYDYGRPRQIHVEEAVTAAHPGPCADDCFQHVEIDQFRTLYESPDFTVAYTRTDCLKGYGRWILPLDGYVRSGDILAGVGECVFLHADATLDTCTNMLVAKAG